jgi:putrescine transport system substrate-binding protein
VTRKLFGLFCGASLALSTGAAVADQARVLRVFNWPEYIAEDTLARFEAETGISVEYDTFESNETLHATVTLGTVHYDVVVPSSTFLRRQVKANVYRPLDRALVPNLAGLDPGVVAAAAAADPDSAHGAIYLWGTSGIGFNPAMVADRLGPDAPTDSWALVFDPENAARLADCGISLLDSGYEIVPLVLAWLGLPPESTTPAHLAAAEAALAAIRPHVRRFDGEAYIDALADEGSAVWFDLLAIPIEARNAEDAHRFIDFLLRPEVIADITNTVYYPNAVAAALPLVDPEIRADPAVYPSPEDLARLFAQPDHDVAGARAVSRLWARIRG